MPSTAISAKGSTATPQPQAPDARAIRDLYTSEFGVSRPTGVTWDRDRKALLVTGALPSGGSQVVTVTPDERRRGRQVLGSLRNGAAAAFDPRSHRIATGTAGVVDAAGTAFSADGTQYVLNARARTIVTVAPDGSVDRVRLRGVAKASLRGLAYEPNERRLYVADTSSDRLYAVDSSGRVVKSQDLADVGITDLQAMTFAPSADPTDAASKQSLFVADAGTVGSLGRIAEVSLAAPVVASATVTPSSVRLVATSAWKPPSPDPSGVTYNPDTEKLLLSDGEVDEMPTYAGANLFEATLSGTLGKTGTTKTTASGWSKEPTGVAYNAENGHLFVSDDDKAEIFEISSAGDDEVFGTADDGSRTSFDTAAFAGLLSDSEDVGYDSERGQVLIIDGLGNELYRVDPGSNDDFDGVPPTGDDVVTHSDLAVLGVLDPEGVAYDEERDTTAVLDNKAIWELDTDGSLLNKVDLSDLEMRHAAGVTIAPASDDSGDLHYYVLDRGVDNNVDPKENDGKLYELATSLSPQGNRRPTAAAGQDQTISLGESVRLTGSGTDDDGPAGLTYKWNRVSGPGTVTFDPDSSASTSVRFTAAGTHVLRLTTSDSLLSANDDVSVTVRAPASPAVTLRASAGGVTAGRAVRLSGLLTGAGGGTTQTVQIYASRGPGFVRAPLRKATTASDGSFSFTDQPTVVTRYTAVAGSLTSSTITVSVRPRLTAALAHSTIRRGRTAVVTGVVSPSAARQPLRLQRLTGRHWSTVRKLTTAARPSARYRFPVRHLGPGRYQFRVVAAAYRGRAPAVSGSVRLRVLRAR